MSIMLSTPLVIGPGSVTAEMMDSGTAAAGHVLTADGAGGADYAAPAGGSPGYLKYVALLTQSGTDAPVATVFENTLGGPVVWTRNAPGEFLGTLTGAFPIDRTLLFSAYSLPTIVGDEICGFFYRASIDAVKVSIYDGSTFIDGVVAYPVEIRVYP